MIVNASIDPKKATFRHYAVTYAMSLITIAAFGLLSLDSYAQYHMQWNSATATVTDVQVDSAHNRGDVLVSLEYTYAVNGVSYDSQSTKVVHIPSTLENRNLLAAQYASGTKINIFYEVKTPDKTMVTEPDKSPINFIGELIATIAMSCLLIFAIYTNIVIVLQKKKLGGKT